jgi:hypothetical protein
LMIHRGSLIETSGMGFHSDHRSWPPQHKSERMDVEQKRFKRNVRKELNEAAMESSENSES